MQTAHFHLVLPLIGHFERDFIIYIEYLKIPLCNTLLGFLNISKGRTMKVFCFVMYLIGT